MSLLPRKAARRLYPLVRRGLVARPHPLRLSTSRDRLAVVMQNLALGFAVKRIPAKNMPVCGWDHVALQRRLS